MIWAALTDFREFKIPNRVVAAALCLYPAYALSNAQASDPAIWIAAVVLALVVFIVGAVMFAAGVMGGGDVKLMAVSALWAGPQLVVPFILVTALSGVVLAAFVAVRTSLQTAMTQSDGSLTLATVASGITGMRHIPVAKLTIPYGGAIASGGIFVAVRLMVG